MPNDPVFEGITTAPILTPNASYFIRFSEDTGIRINVDASNYITVNVFYIDRIHKKVHLFDLLRDISPEMIQEDCLKQIQEEAEQK